GQPVADLAPLVLRQFLGLVQGAGTIKLAHEHAVYTWLALGHVPRVGAHQEGNFGFGEQLAQAAHPGEGEGHITAVVELDSKESPDRLALDLRTRRVRQTGRLFIDLEPRTPR